MVGRALVDADERVGAILLLVLRYDVGRRGRRPLLFRVRRATPERAPIGFQRLRVRAQRAYYHVPPGHIGGRLAVEWDPRR